MLTSNEEALSLYRRCLLLRAGGLTLSGEAAPVRGCHLVSYGLFSKRGVRDGIVPFEQSCQWLIYALFDPFQIPESSLVVEIHEVRIQDH